MLKDFCIAQKSADNNPKLLHLVNTKIWTVLNNFISILMESSTYKYKMEQTLIATICPHSTTNSGM